MKRLIRDNLKLVIAFILGGMFFSGITYATIYNFASSDVEHTQANGTKTSVSNALNELYMKSVQGDAEKENILLGKTALVKGKLVEGHMNDYATSTGQSCTLENANNNLYIKPSNNGYYTSSSSFNTGISYNPTGTGGEAATTGTSIDSSSTSVVLSGSNLLLAGKSKITIPAGYYSSGIDVSSVGGAHEYDLANGEWPMIAAMGKTVTNKWMIAPFTGVYNVIAFGSRSGDYKYPVKVYVNDVQAFSWTAEDSKDAQRKTGTITANEGDIIRVTAGNQSNVGMGFSACAVYYNPASN